MKYFIKTFGCQMNEHDSEIISGLMQQAGYSLCGDEAEAEILIINTCCVRESAENKILGYALSLKGRKKKEEDLIIALCGCMTQQENVVANLAQNAKHIDIILGTYAQHRLPQYIAEAIAGSTQIVDTTTGSESMPDTMPTIREDKVKAQVNIVYGCNNFCTYCIVPYVRNEERSRSKEAIIAEVRELASLGYKEVLLLGQNVNSYGKDFEESYDFSDLMADVAKVSGIERIRFMTSHPRDFNEKLIDTIRDNANICKSVHLPLQSGSNRTLEEMNRGYTCEDYALKIALLREKIGGNIGLTTDLIVGFPGETDEDFATTLEFIEKCHFDAAYTFMYSKRSGTPAAERMDQVDEKVKKARLNALIEMQNRVSLEINKKLEGSILEVLVEGASKTNAAMFTGRSDCNKIVVFKGSSDLVGQIIKIRITEAKTWSLDGEIL